MKNIKIIDFKQEQERIRNINLYAEPLERCVLCGRLTDVSTTKKISQRKFYIDGVGQLCETCCFDLYGN